MDTIGSDHSPAPPEMKTGANFFRVWGGISGAQHTLSLLLTEAQNHGAALPPISNMLSRNVAERFSLPGTKGRIEVGCDADLALVDLMSEFEVRTEDLFYRHRQTPYASRRLRGQVARTLLHGRTIFRDGKFVATPAGRLLKPQR